VNNQECYAGNCIDLFSLPTGTAFMTNMTEIMCKSGRAFGKFCTELNFLGPKDYVYNNTQGAVCEYNWTALNITQPYYSGECAWDGGFKTYCAKLGNEHEMYVEWIGKLKTWYNGDGMNVHSFRRDVFSGDLKVLTGKVFNWPHLINADKCAISLIASGTTLNLSIVAFVGSLLFFLF